MTSFPRQSYVLWRVSYPWETSDPFYRFSRFRFWLNCRNYPIWYYFSFSDIQINDDLGASILFLWEHFPSIFFHNRNQQNLISKSHQWWWSGLLFINSDYSGFGADVQKIDCTDKIFFPRNSTCLQDFQDLFFMGTIKSLQRSVLFSRLYSFTPSMILSNENIYEVVERDLVWNHFLVPVWDDNPVKIVFNSFCLFELYGNYCYVDTPLSFCLLKEPFFGIGMILLIIQ